MTVRACIAAAFAGLESCAKLAPAQQGVQVALIEHARSAGVVELAENGMADAWHLLSSRAGEPPPQSTFTPGFKTLPANEGLSERYFARHDRLLRHLKTPTELVARFDRVPAGFARSNFVEGYLSSIGNSACYGADILTGDLRFYRGARKAVREVFGRDADALLIRRLAASNAFANAFLAEPLDTSVYDVMTIFDDWRRHESIHKLSQRIAGQRRMRSDIGVYALGQAGGAVWPPIAWAVKLGEFVVRKVRAPR